VLKNFSSYYGLFLSNARRYLLYYLFRHPYFYAGPVLFSRLAPLLRVKVRPPR
jgi:hypothetical protein